MKSFIVIKFFKLTILREREIKRKKSKRKQPRLSCSLSLLYTAYSMKKQTRLKDKIALIYNHALKGLEYRTRKYSCIYYQTQLIVHCYNKITYLFLSGKKLSHEARGSLVFTYFRFGHRIYFFSIKENVLCNYQIIEIIANLLCSFSFFHYPFRLACAKLYVSS